jgi:ABC-type Fe3+-hydroxamate transport system substrate-binding protein
LETSLSAALGKRASVRIVSLVPSVTETLTAWDRTPIACTRFCERPDLRHIGGTKDPDIDLIAGLSPDLVVMDAEENRREDHDSLLDRGIAVHVLHVRSLLDVNPSMTELAERVDARWEPFQLSKDVPRRARAFVPIWRNPWIALGAPTYGDSLLSHLGVENVIAGEGPYPRVALDDIASRAPDVVLAPSEPYPFSKRQLPELSAIAPTVFVDGKNLFWWGVRSAGAVAQLNCELEVALLNLDSSGGRPFS